MERNIKIISMRKRECSNISCEHVYLIKLYVIECLHKSSNVNDKILVCLSVCHCTKTGKVTRPAVSKVSPLKAMKEVTSV